MKSLPSTEPSKLIPATLNVKMIRARSAAVLKMLGIDMNRVLSSDLKLSEVLTSLMRRATLMILKIVTFTLRDSRSYSSTATSESMTIMKSNLFQLTYQ
jgi:hypothetical protein